MKRHRGSLAPRCALLAAIVASAAAAQSVEPTPPAPTFFETVDVNVINVEVIVTDGGKPVRGLGRDDFELYDDGKPIEITNFYAVDEATAEATPGEEDGVGRDPLDRDSIIIVVDNTFIAPGERKQVFLALERELERLLTAGAQVMVVNKDRTIKIEQGFTSDRVAIETALAAIAKHGGTSAMRRSTERAILRDIAIGTRALSDSDAGDTASFGGELDVGVADAVMTLNQVAAYASETFQDVRRSVQTLRAFFNSLSGLPGRKSVLYVSDGLPLRPAEFLYRAWFDKYSVYSSEAGVSNPEEAADGYDTTQEVIELVADASSNRIAFYTVSSGTTPASSSASPRNAGFRDVTRIAAEMVAPDLQGLMLLARSTGGDAAAEVASVDNLVLQLTDDLTSYYSLGYASPHGGDGKVHKVEVKVKRPGVRVRYLETYRDKNSDQRMGDRTLSALLLESGANPLEVRVEVKDAQRDKKDTWVVPIEVRLPIAKVALVPEATSHVGSLSVFIVVRDEEGRVSDPTKVHLPVNIPNAQFASSMTGEAAYATNIRMRSGEQTLGVGVRDDLSEIGSTVNVKLNPGG
jgi:VWFA-related protein